MESNYSTKENHGFSNIEIFQADSFLDVVACTPSNTSLVEGARDAQQRFSGKHQSLARPWGDGVCPSLVVQQLSDKLNQATNSGDNRLGNDPC